MKNDRYEVQLMDCIYKNLYMYEKDISDNIKSYEENLISKGYLKDKSGASYKALFSNMEKDKNFIFLPERGFLSEMEYFQYSNIDSLRICKKNIKIDSDKSQKLALLTNNVTKNKIESLRIFATKINSILDEDDFELEYYKFMIFGLFNMYESKNN